MEDFNENEKNIKNEKLIHNKIIPINNISTISKATVKIILSDGVGSGFFLKTLKKNKTPFYCLITNHHVINEKDEIKNKNEITLIFDGKKELKIKLDEEERKIFDLMKYLDLKLDVAIVEILPKDKVDDSNFFLPYDEINELNKGFIGKEIRISQYPEGNQLSLSNGKIVKIFESNNNCFFHDADTKKGSSGSPIMFGGEEKVIGIHKGTNTKKNIGIYIGIVIDIIYNYIKNEKRKEFYENGKPKYEGKFKDDEYDDEAATYYFENEDYYIGPFKNNKKNGKGKEYYKNRKLKYEGHFRDDKYDDENGKYYYENEEFYIGSFKEGQKNGKGIEYYEKDKIKYDGKYLNDLYEGNEEKFYFENGDIYIGPFKEGKKNGKGCLIKNNGDIEEIEYINDELLIKKESNDENNNNNDNNIDNNIDEDNESNNNNIHNNINNKTEVDKESNNNNIQNNEKDMIKNNKDNGQYSNVNNSNSNNNSNNTSSYKENNNSYDNMLKNFIIPLADIFSPVAKKLGIECTKSSCGHKAENHTKIEDGKWKCNICPEDNNICSMFIY